MKLLFYINAIHDGGAERVMVNLAEKFAKDGCEVILLTSFVAPWEYPVSQRVKRLSIEQKEIVQNRLMRNYTRIRQIRKICKEEKPDIVISFMQEPNFRAILATLGLQIKTVVSVRNDPNREYAGFIGKIVGKVLLPLADGCVFQTKQAQEWFPEKLQKKSTIIFNEVAESFFGLERNPDKNVVALGRLSSQKNYPIMINAFARIADKYPETKLLIYGEGPDREALEKLIHSSGMCDRVVLMGRTTNAQEVLRRAGLYVLSSDYEGMPNALMEALAAGVPSISTDCPCGGPKMLIEHEKNGLLIPVGDEEALVAALDRLLSNPAYAEQLGANAREDAKRYAPDKIFRQWKQYIEECAAR